MPCLCLARSINWYWVDGGDDLRLGGKPQAWQRTNSCPQVCISVHDSHDSRAVYLETGDQHWHCGPYRPWGLWLPLPFTSSPELLQITLGPSRVILWDLQSRFIQTRCHSFCLNNIAKTLTGLLVLWQLEHTDKWCCWLRLIIVVLF